MTTKTAQFTPGPWTVSAGRVITTSSGQFYLTYGKDKYGNPLFKDFVELDNNAHLIAAAPAMYEALAKLRLEAIHYRNTGVGKQFLNEAIEQAEQAINQVWGEGNHDTKREG